MTKLDYSRPIHSGASREHHEVYWASSAQRDLIRKLCAERGRPLPRNFSEMTSQWASNYIETLKAMPRRRNSSDDDVLAALPATAAQIAKATGMPITHTGGALSRLLRAGRAVKVGKEWQPIS